MHAAQIYISCLQILCQPHNKAKGHLNTTDYAAHPELCSPGLNVAARQALEERVAELEAKAEVEAERTAELEGRVAELEELNDRAFWEKRCISSPMHECNDEDGWKHECLDDDEN
jgi:hypothetical protein